MKTVHSNTKQLHTEQEEEDEAAIKEMKRNQLPVWFLLFSLYEKTPEGWSEREITVKNNNSFSVQYQCLCIGFGSLGSLWCKR